jgi:hypothetical protein
MCNMPEKAEWSAYLAIRAAVTPLDNPEGIPTVRRFDRATHRSAKASGYAKYNIAKYLGTGPRDG